MAESTILLQPRFSKDITDKRELFSLEEAVSTLNKSQVLSCVAKTDVTRVNVEVSGDSSCPILKQTNADTINGLEVSRQEIKGVEYTPSSVGIYPNHVKVSLGQSTGSKRMYALHFKLG
tara:strand:- start:296 stop:652 length:357 start_codon:yes stop_codon:yes gene_type:complete